MADNCNFDAVPLSEVEVIRTPNLFSANYTNQDFWSMKARLIQFIEEQFADEFKDFVESSLAILLIENWAFLADTLSFKLDQIVNELFIDTVTEVENAFRLSKLVGFEPQPPIASRAMFSATLGSLLDVDLTMPTPVVVDVVSNDVPTTFELFPSDENDNPLFDEDIIIPAGQFTNTSIVGLEGLTVVESFPGDGSINQTITLASNPVIFDSIRVDIDGVQWERVDFFTDSKPRREHRVEFTSDYEGFIIFGNNSAGAIPPIGSTIVVTFRTGGGVVGNIITNAATVQQTFEVIGFGFNVPVELTNYTRGEFGYNGDGLEEIRLKLPAFLRTQDRAVTGNDYKTLADQFATSFNGTIGKSTAALRNHGCAGNIIDLFVLAQDGDIGLQEANDSLKVALGEELDDKKMFTDFVCIKDGVVIDVDVSVEVIMDKFFRNFKEEILVRTQNRIIEFFNLVNWEYGQDLRDTDIIQALADIREIKRTDVTFTTIDPDNSGSIVTAQYFEIIRPDDITIGFTFE